MLVGLGEAFVEAIDDVVLGLAPLRAEKARRMLGRRHGYDMLTGARGGKAVDLGALSSPACAVGDLLAAVPEIAELDLNPVLATDSGFVAGLADSRAIPSQCGPGSRSRFASPERGTGRRSQRQTGSRPLLKSHE